ncbi:sensor histidine kinase [Salinarimonas ramus]|uniref:histidine kinase n=1 Tax=Salinarimonas ramus TaxID=690164 RepID=A0A917Q678_9HYPH|nr:HAMP domain-containing sensor histidine kinase [Salinarimonas ramus]GGK29747.1 histidine kinase [Salinarimonas ramus]
MRSATSLRTRLVAAGLASIALALALCAFGLGLLFERHVERRLVAELTVQLDQLVAGIDRAPDGGFVVARYPGDPRFVQPLSGLYWQIEVAGTELRARSLWDERLDLPQDVVGDGAVHVHRISGPLDASLLAVEREVVLPPRLGETRARVAAAVDRAEVARATAAFRADLLPYLLVIGLLLALASVAQVRVGLRPLALVAKRVAAVRSGVATRVGADFPAEVAPLAGELDGLIAAREVDVAKARARAADLAHGLRTPLQALEGDVARLRERGEDALADDVAAILSAMSRTVERELARARLAGRSSAARAEVRAIAERVVAVVRRTPDGAARDWAVEIAPALAARIDPDDLTEALGNLVENAARHARTRIVLSAEREGARIRLAVADDGPGIAAELVETVLARGGRLDARGSGAGLGLAIVQDVAEAWGGSFACETSEAGFTAALDLPAAA